VSLRLDKGEVLSVLGPSGSGKSTLLKIISSLVKHDGGDINFNGKNIKELNIFDYRQRVRYVFPKPQFIQGSVYDHLKAVLTLTSRDIRTYLSDIKNLLSDFKLSEDTLKNKTSDLSTGEAKRIYLIQNLLIPAEVYLLDEAFSGIDQSLVNGLFDLVKSKSYGVILTTHNLSLARYAGGKSLFIKDGRILCETCDFYESETHSDVIYYIKGGNSQ
jgi:putative ABC transport system ATP-binding protein